jgi:hypothetical protein
VGALDEGQGGAPAVFEALDEDLRAPRRGLDVHEGAGLGEGLVEVKGHGL